MYGVVSNNNNCVGTVKRNSQNGEIRGEKSMLWEMIQRSKVDSGDFHAKGRSCLHN